MPTKKETIETVYFGSDGFGSLKQITKDAKTKDDTITYEDVREWKSKQSVGQNAKPYGSNSFITQEPYQEYQCDLFFWPKPRSSELQRTRATWRGEQKIWSKHTNAIIIVDIFTQFTQVVPLKKQKYTRCYRGMEVLPLVNTDGVLRSKRDWIVPVYWHSDGGEVFNGVSWTIYHWTTCPRVLV